MDLIYVFENKLKSAITTIVEADKFGENSFGQQGFVFKDGLAFGFEGKTLLVFRNVSDEFKRLANEKLKEFTIEVLDEEKTKEITKMLDEEDEAAQKGIGDIFG